MHGIHYHNLNDSFFAIFAAAASRRKAIAAKVNKNLLLVIFLHRAADVVLEHDQIGNLVNFRSQCMQVTRSQLLEFAEKL